MERRRWWLSILPSSFAAVLGAVMLVSQIAIQYRGGHPDSLLVYAGVGLAVGMPLARVLDGARNKNGNGGPK